MVGQVNLDTNVLPTSVNPIVITKEVDPLQEFFLRPLRLANYLWTATGFDTDGYAKFDPWALYLNNTFVQKKLNNYQYLRGKLHVQFHVNGTPLHYGMILAAYEPCDALNDKRISSALLEWGSQLPHVKLFAGINEASELVLPLTNSKGYIDVTSATGAQVGVVHMMEVNGLEMDNAASATTIGVTVYAWLEDHELSINTVSPVATFTPQSKVLVGANSKELKKKGNVEAVASAIADFSGRLKTAPVIGTFATAAEMGASAVSSIAALFGWSKPLDQNHHAIFQTNQTQNMCTDAGLDNAYKLTHDPKAELTVDSALTGYDDGDEMTIASIASRWTYMNTFTWATTDAIDTVLKSIPVTPRWVRTTAVTGGVRYNPSALWFATTPFRHWSGTIEYKLEFICTARQKGRVLITHEPNGAFTSTSTVTNSTAIIDLETGGEYTIAIPWAKADPMLLASNMDTSAFIYNTATCNGAVFVSVLNELNSPIASASVYVNIYIRAGSDYKVHNHVPVNLAKYTYFPTQSKTLEIYKNPLPPGVALSYTGESYVSFRSMLKAYQFYSMLSPTASDLLTPDAYYAWTLSHPLYPLQPGYTPQPSWSLHTTVAAAAYNYTTMTLYNYLSPAFNAQRGSMRYLMTGTQCDPPNTISRNTHWVTKRTAGIVTAIVNIFTIVYGTATASASQLSYFPLQNWSYFLEGAQVFSGHENIHVEVPDSLTDKRYHTTNPSNAFQYSGTTAFSIVSNMVATDANDATPLLAAFVATGEDFNLSFFRGAPTIYFQTTMPLPS
jgi:hypothetical protein